MNSAVDLWPDDLIAEIPRVPADILHEQANALGTRTKNVVQARVMTDTDQQGDFIISFMLFSPVLDGYQYELFRGWHGVELYPVHIGESEIADEASFVRYLRTLFAEQRTLRIVRAIVAQARAREPSRRTRRSEPEPAPSDDYTDDDIPF